MQTRARGQEDARIEAGAAALANRVGSWMRWLVQEVVRRRELLRQRRALLELDDHLLRDIGVRREDALREADRLLWQDALGRRIEVLPAASRRSGGNRRESNSSLAGQGAAGVKRRT